MGLETPMTVSVFPEGCETQYPEADCSFIVPAPAFTGVSDGFLNDTQDDRTQKQRKKMIPAGIAVLFMMNMIIKENRMRDYPILFIDWN